MVEIFTIKNLEEGDPLVRFDPTIDLPQLQTLPRGYVMSGGRRKFVLYNTSNAGELILMLGPDFATHGVYTHAKMDRWFEYFHSEKNASCRVLGGGGVFFSLDQGVWFVSIGGESGAFGAVPQKLMLSLQNELKEAFQVGVDYNPNLR